MHEQAVTFCQGTSGISHTAAQESLFKSCQWFDGLTMSGFILNRDASFKPFSRVIRSSLFLTGLWTDLLTPLEKK
jgi:hypothetical protein